MGPVRVEPRLPTLAVCDRPRQGMQRLLVCGIRNVNLCPQWHGFTKKHEDGAVGARDHGSWWKPSRVYETPLGFTKFYCVHSTSTQYAWESFRRASPRLLVLNGEALASSLPPGQDDSGYQQAPRLLLSATFNPPPCFRFSPHSGMLVF